MTNEMLFRLSNPALVVIIVVIVGGSTAIGVYVGRRLENRDEIRELVGAVQAALLGFVALLLAFGLTMAVGRYESRRASLATEANAIGTGFLRSQTIAEPERSQSIELLRQYALERQTLSTQLVGSASSAASVQRSSGIQRELWALASSSMSADPTGSAPRLYVESLNTMFDAGSLREAAFIDRVPDSVVYLQIGGAALALCLLGLYLATLGRRVVEATLAAGMVSLILLVAIDLDRPQRGLITVSSRPIDSVVQSMQRDPAASPP